MKEFINTNRFGQLIIEYVLFESRIPIIFTCRNATKDLFICVCCQNNSQGNRWLIGKTEAESIIKLLKDELSVRQLLLKCCTEKIMVFQDKLQFYEDDNESVWDETSVFLPKQDSFMYSEPGEFDEEIEYYQSLLKVRYSNDSYATILTSIDSLCVNGSAIVKGLSAFADILNNLTVSSEMIRTMEVMGRLYLDSYTEKSDYVNCTEDNSLIDNKEIELNSNEEQISIDTKTESSVRFLDAA